MPFLNEKTRKTYTVSQKLKGKIKSGTQEIVPTRPKKTKGEGGVVDATRRHTGLTDILEWVGKASGINDDVCASFSEGDKDGDGLNTIKFLTLYSVKAREPLAFSKQPGNIPDVISIENTLTQLKCLNLEKNSPSVRTCLN